MAKSDEFSRLFEDAVPASTEKQLDTADKGNALRALMMYLAGIVGIDIIPVLMKTDWAAIAGPTYGPWIATALGLGSGLALDLFRRWKTDNAPGTATPNLDPPPSDQNPYNGI